MEMVEPEARPRYAVVPSPLFLRGPGLIKGQTSSRENQRIGVFSSPLYAFP